MMLKESLRKRALCVMAAIGAVVFGEAVNAQVKDGSKLVVAEMVTDAPDAGKPFTVGIRLTIEPDWYVYWKNPGDAGLPVEVQWELPAGWKAGELQFPVPLKFVHDDLVSYGYKKEVVLLTTITPNGPAGNHLKAKLDWLVCRESCLRGKGEISLDLNKPTDRQKASLIQRSRDRLPRPVAELGVSIGETSVGRENDGWVLHVDLEGKESNRVTDFFPLINNEIFLDFNSIRIEESRLTMKFSRQDSHEAHTELKGLLVVDGKGFECSIQVHVPSR